MLRANYLFLDGTRSVTESMVSGTLAGELSFLSRTKRNAIVSAERDSVLWKMTITDHESMGKKEGMVFCRTLDHSILRISIEEQEVLMVCFLLFLALEVIADELAATGTFDIVVMRSLVIFLGGFFGIAYEVN